MAIAMQTLDCSNEASAMMSSGNGCVQILLYAWTSQRLAAVPRVRVATVARMSMLQVFYSTAVVMLSMKGQTRNKIFEMILTITYVAVLQEKSSA